MSLTAADVAEIMRLVEQSSFDELTLEMAGLKVSLRRGGAPEVSTGRRSPGAASVIAPAAMPAGASTTAAGTPAAAALAAPGPGNGAAPADPNVHEVASPLLGTFYRAPKPGAPPFVEVGSVVEADTIVAIIEVMKLMNTVRAGMRGTVTEINVSDGALVEYDQALLRIRKTV